MTSGQTSPNTQREPRTSPSAGSGGRVNVALVQMNCAAAKQKNVDKALARIAEAAAAGANVICLQELFHGLYPCQSEDHARFEEAEPIPGPTSEALAAAAKNMATATIYHRDLMEACTAVQRPADIAKLAQASETSVRAEPDPEAWYHVGALLAACGQSDAALRLLKAAVQQNYCAHEALLDDPLLKDLRKETAFNDVLTQSTQGEALIKQGPH